MSKLRGNTKLLLAVTVFMMAISFGLFVIFSAFQSEPIPVQAKQEVQEIPEIQQKRIELENITETNEELKQIEKRKQEIYTELLVLYNTPSNPEVQDRINSLEEENSNLTEWVKSNVEGG